MDWTQAITEWEKILGQEFVNVDPKDRQSAQTATFATEQTIPVILSPANTHEVQACLKIAQKYRCPLYPVSRGKNWGLGSKVPVLDGCGLLMLDRLNRILEVNEKLGYMTVEPGVSFRQAYEYLNSQNSQLMVSVIGGSPDASIIGNTIERGDGVGPAGVRLHHCCAFEVILPDGEKVHTGMHRFENAHTKAVSQWGVGPAIDGLFTQSNFGIITQMTLWLTPKPTWFQAFMVELKNSRSLAQLIDTLQPLALQGVIAPGGLDFWNGYKLLARSHQYPWERQRNSTPLLPVQFLGIDRWFACGSQYCASQAHGDADRAMIEATLQGYQSQLTYIDQDSDPEVLAGNPMLGIPYDDNVFSTYWRKKTPAPTDSMDPDRDGCGVHWLCLELPFDGQLVQALIQQLEKLILDQGFEPNLGFSAISGRTLRGFAAVMYDRSVEGEDERAKVCHDQLMQLLVDEGHIPNRLGIQSMDLLPNSQCGYDAFIRKLKAHLDPHQVLAPGRYVPR